VTVPEILTLIGALTTAIVTVITALRVGGVKRDLATYNESKVGELAAADETRRIDAIAPTDRTAKEARHLLDAGDDTTGGGRGVRLNVAKLIGLCVGMVCITTLLALERVDGTAGAAMLSAVIFYLIGNGVNAKRGKQDVAVIQPAPEGRRADDQDAA